MNVPGLLREFVPRWDTLFLNLSKADNLESTGLPVVAEVFQVLQAIGATEMEVAAALQKAADALDALPDSDSGTWQKLFIYLYLLVAHKRPPEEQHDLFAIVGQSIVQHRSDWEEAKMTGAQVLINQGLQQGLQQGEQKGVQKGMHALLLTQMRTRFGVLRPDIEVKVRSLSASDAETIAIKHWTQRKSLSWGCNSGAGAPNSRARAR